MEHNPILLNEHQAGGTKGGTSLGGGGGGGGGRIWNKKLSSLQ